jgi:ribose transport system permease protein
MSVPQEWQTVVTGVIIIVAVYMDILRRHKPTTVSVTVTPSV